MKPHISRKRIRALQYPADATFRCTVVNNQIYPLMPRQIANNLGINPRDRLELPRPIPAIMRPSQPGGGMRLPLRGHAVGEGGIGDT
jgi:hypothetical protein